MWWVARCITGKVQYTGWVARHFRVFASLLSAEDDETKINEIADKTNRDMPCISTKQPPAHKREGCRQKNPWFGSRSSLLLPPVGPNQPTNQPTRRRSPLFAGASDETAACRPLKRAWRLLSRHPLSPAEGRTKQLEPNFQFSLSEALYILARLTGHRV